MRASTPPWHSAPAATVVLHSQSGVALDRWLNETIRRPGRNLQIVVAVADPDLARSWLGPKSIRVDNFIRIDNGSSLDTIVGICESKRMVLIDTDHTEPVDLYELHAELENARLVIPAEMSFTPVSRHAASANTPYLAVRRDTLASLPPAILSDRLLANSVIETAIANRTELTVSARVACPECVMSPVGDRESVLVLADSVPRRSPDPDGWRVAQILCHLAARPGSLRTTLVVTDDRSDTNIEFWSDLGVEVMFATTDLEEVISAKSFGYGMVVVAGKGVALRAARILAESQPQAKLVVESGVIAALTRPEAPAALFPSMERPGQATLSRMRDSRDQQLLRPADEVWTRSESESKVVAALGCSAKIRLVEPSIGLPVATSMADLSTNSAVAPVMLHREYLEPDLGAADLINQLSHSGVLTDITIVSDRELRRGDDDSPVEIARGDRWIERLQKASLMVLAREHGPTAWSHLIDAARCGLPVVALPTAIAEVDHQHHDGLTISDPDRLAHDIELVRHGSKSSVPMSFGSVDPDSRVAAFLTEAGVDPTTRLDPDHLIDSWHRSGPFPRARDMSRMRWRRDDISPIIPIEGHPNPLISIVMPTYNPPLWALERAVDSVQAQTYDNWQLCIADDASPDTEVLEYLRRIAADDARITIVERRHNGGIAAATNTALQVASGEFVAMLDHDDEISPDALATFISLLADHPDIDFVYSDEDKIQADGEHFHLFGKPAWSPDLFLSFNYVCHFAIYRRSLVEKVGGLRLGFDGAQDYDLALRVSESTDRIAHIPRNLYHWRAIPGSTAFGLDEKSGAWQAGQRAVTDALARREERATVHKGFEFGTYRVRYLIRGKPKVSVVIPTRDRVELLDACVRSLHQVAKISSVDIDIIIVDNESTDQGTIDWLARHDGSVLSYPHQFSYARMMNLAVEHADGDLLLFLNNDTTAIASDWLEAMIEQAQRPSVGAVGARLIFPDGRVQHEGIILGVGGFAANVSASHYFYLGSQIRNCCSVTAACQMMRPEPFFAVGGFEERLRVAFNDVDLGIRIHQAGYDVVYTPYAVLQHDESASRGLLHPAHDEAFARRRWADSSRYDPYYSPALSQKVPYVALDG